MKTRSASHSYLFNAIFLLILVSIGCRKDESKIIKEKVTGHVQKGPFVNGTSITMSELSSSLAQTGNVFTTQISNNVGSFEIDNIILTSGYVEFSASGYYFDEIKGSLSIAPLNLFALSDIRDISTVNVNILTHLEKQRVNYLIKHNKSFSEAKKTAQSEILSIFGIDLINISNSESLDISASSESNAVLLAISIILQGNRSVGDLTELLANISNDIKEDGILNTATILTDLRNSAKELVLSAIRSNLEKRYQDIGVNATIPGFEKYVNDFLSFTGEKAAAITGQTTDITTSGATFNGLINPDYVSTTVYFEWGETSNYDMSVPAIQNPVTGGSSVNISAAVTGLLPGTIYHVRVKAENSKGVSYGSDSTFTTLGKVPDAVATSATNIFLSSATLNGHVNANYLSTATDFEWGTTTDYGNLITAVQSPVTGNEAVNVNADLTGLTEETTYHYRIRAVNSLGTTLSSDKTFTTEGKSPIPLTEAATNIQMTSATLNGTVNANSFSTTVAFKWGTNLDYSNSITAPQSPLNSMTYIDVSADLTGLIPGETYNFRIEATNEYGTKTSEDFTFTTLAPVTDIDGNVYDTRSIGSQIWMTSNLKTTKYRNGDLIGTTSTATLDISGESNPKYEWAYDGDESNVSTYGRLYTWYAAADNREICPTGWHLPDDGDWASLADYLANNGFGFEGSGTDIGKAMASSSGWGEDPTPGNIGNDQGSNNASGFSALPGGYRTDDNVFSVIGYFSIWWSSTEFISTLAWERILNSSDSNLARNYTGTKKSGVSVRCLRD
jgi:uncharacterized protein (TIGR02145 family)